MSELDVLGFREFTDEERAHIEREFLANKDVLDEPARVHVKDVLDDFGWEEMTDANSLDIG